MIGGAFGGTPTGAWIPGSGCLEIGHRYPFKIGSSASLGC
jgi:hypothetical protein